MFAVSARANLRTLIPVICAVIQLAEPSTVSALYRRPAQSLEALFGLVMLF